MLPFRFDRETDSRPAGPRGLQLQQIAGHVGDGLLGPLLLSHPNLAADAAKLRPLLRAADVLLHQLDLRGRHEDFRAAIELQLQVLLDVLALLDQLQPEIAGDAVGHMNDKVPLAQL